MRKLRTVNLSSALDGSAPNWRYRPRPGNSQQILESEGPVGQPQVEIEAQGGPLERREDVQVDGDRMADDLLEELLAEPDGAVPQRGLVGLLWIPPELVFIGYKRADPFEPSFVLVDERHGASKQPLHLVSEAGLLSSLAAAAALDPQRQHELRKRAAQDELAALGSHRFGRDPGQQQAGNVAERELVKPAGAHDQGVGAVAANVLFPVAGVGAGQAAQRHQPSHEAQIRVRFAGPCELVYLIEAGEMLLCRLRHSAERLGRAGQIGDDFTDRNQLAALTLHGFILPCTSDKTGTPGLYTAGASRPAITSDASGGRCQIREWDASSISRASTPSCQQSRDISSQGISGVQILCPA